MSAVARLSTGTYDQLPAMVSGWRNYSGSLARLDDPLTVKQEKELAERYLTPMLLCAKPDSIDIRRWFIKCLSNDQTAFTGFTSLVDVNGFDSIGYDGTVRLLPSASFVEPFALARLDEAGKQKLLGLKEQLDTLDSTQVESIDSVMQQADALCPIDESRAKGKSPIFFYGISDKPFQLPLSLYNRMASAACLAYTVLSDAARAMGNGSAASRDILTGSIDFMVAGDDIYLIDIGSPAVGYVADILACSRALGTEPDIGIDRIAATLDGQLTVARSLQSRQLGFFVQEKQYLVDQLRSRGLVVDEIYDNDNEAMVMGTPLPSMAFDYITRNQPLRNQVLQGISGELAKLGVRIPAGVCLQPDDFRLARFYDETRIGQEDYGLLIKKKTFFGEYERGSGYFKPLVTPIWGRELRAGANRTTLFEQFIPSLLDIDIAGAGPGKRCYEVRLYFTAGERR